MRSTSADLPTIHYTKSFREAGPPANRPPFLEPLFSWRRSSIPTPNLRRWLSLTYSLSTMPSRSSHVVANGEILLFFVAQLESFKFELTPRNEVINQWLLVACRNDKLRRWSLDERS